MKPYVSLFYNDTQERHSSMPRRVEKAYISVYDQGRRTRKIMERNQRNGKISKTIIPPEYSSIKESEEEKSAKNEILKTASHPHVQQIYIFNITTPADIDKTISTIMRSISQIL